MFTPRAWRIGVLNRRTCWLILPRRISAVKIADFGVSKTKEASRRYSNQTTTATTLYMAPEVLKLGDDPHKAKFNPMKADVFFEILQIWGGVKTFRGLITLSQ